MKKKAGLLRRSIRLKTEGGRNESRRPAPETAGLDKETAVVRE
jgi:hypothetical protein